MGAGAETGAARPESGGRNGEASRDSVPGSRRHAATKTRATSLNRSWRSAPIFLPINDIMIGITKKSANKKASRPSGPTSKRAGHGAKYASVNEAPRSHTPRREVDLKIH